MAAIYTVEIEVDAASEAVETMRRRRHELTLRPRVNRLRQIAEQVDRLDRAIEAMDVVVQKHTDAVASQLTSRPPMIPPPDPDSGLTREGPFGRNV